MILYDLAGSHDDLRFSPYCWRVKMSLAHKGLAVDSRPWRFTEKDAIAFSDQKKVPVLVDGEQVIHDSWDIMNYLDRAYGEAPRLFVSEAERQTAFNLKLWVDKTVHLPLFKVILMDIYGCLHEKDRETFRSSREARMGISLENFSDASGASIQSFRSLLEPVREVLEWQPFLSGEQASGSDYILFGTFQWARCTSSIRLLEDGDAISLWGQRMLALFNGMACKALTASDL